MTRDVDQERAGRFLERHETYLLMHHESDRAVVAANVEAELAAVRLEERRAIAAWMRERSRIPYLHDEMAVSLLPRLADAIERGEHGS